MINERNRSDDLATGLDEYSAPELADEAVDKFNGWAGARGYDATVERFHWGDFSIHVTLWDHRIATVYNNLDEFEKVARRVDEGEFEPLMMEVTA